MPPGLLLPLRSALTRCAADFGLAEHEETLRASLQAAIYCDAEDAEGRERALSLPAPRQPTGGFARQHMVGTLAYTAPEVLMRRVAGRPADVYSLAITLCELATATAPYADRARNVALAHTVLDLSYNERDLAVAIASEGLRPQLPPPAASPPPGLCELLESCWCASADARPTAADVKAALEGLGRRYAQQQGLPDACLRPIWRAPPPPPPPPPPPEEVDAVLCSGGGDPAAAPSWPVGCAYAPVVTAAALATCGLRGADKMEDRHLVLSPLPGAPPHAHLFAVFDGHRGAEAAAFAAQALPRALAAAWAQPDAQPHSSLARAFVQIDSAFRVLDEARAQGDAAANPAALRRYPGATAVAALLWGDAVYVANAGDCRVMLVRDGSGVALTRDHTADDPRERQRIEEAGGALAQDAQGHWRVGEAAIAVTRSLGDFDLREAGMTPEPEITRVELEPEDEFLVIACDGLWDVLSVDEVTQLVLSTVKEPGMAAKRLVAEVRCLLRVCVCV